MNLSEHYKNNLDKNQLLTIIRLSFVDNASNLYNSTTSKNQNVVTVCL